MNKKREKRIPPSHSMLKKVVLLAMLCIILIFLYKYYFQKTGYLFIDSAPTGAKVQIDGKTNSSNTPCLVGPLKAGKHAIKLELHGYDVWQAVIKTPGKDTLWLTPELLVKAGTYSILHIASTPGEASIFIDENRQETVTPATLNNLIPGSHKIQLRKNGFFPIDTLIYVQPGEQNIEFFLQRAKGKLVINSTPANAQIRLNGELLSTKTPYIFNDIGAGIHQVEISSNGFKSVHRTVNVSADETLSLDVNLHRASEKSNLGEILITAAIVTDNDRERATFPALIIDGEVKGQAPCTLQLAAGEYTIEANLTGFEPKQKTVEIHAGQTINYKFEFRKEPQ
ncbi:MAG: PEGA domain-containing protein [Deferribacteres bacterium]|nr:PEGA domain-containing protein [candidate division KSB1 bacterium]MCB9502466.1 PEGA domain-containing protein [Deferribacteres bacterium]